ncbi:MAG: Nif3-like dinuclear metal center hexameric protein [Candidatus Kapabacteria bacterium]|nr:Nif3-like dinuclear metal center hexameric protein [Candidatus Kapabacteria bacterium]
MDGDRIGLQVQSSVTEVSKVLVAYELIDEVIDEAFKNDFNCIVTFHPLIYKPLQALIEDERVGKLASRLIKNDIMHFVVHTNFDSHKNGTNTLIADNLGLINRKFIVPDPDFNDKGMGLVGLLPNPLSVEKFVEMCSQVFKSPLRYNVGNGSDIQKVAVIGGSGTSFLNDAANTKADVIITSDISYHTFHAFVGKMMLIDPGHFETEQFVSEALFNQLKVVFKDYDVEFELSKTYTNPVKYYPNTSHYIEKQSNNLKNI